MYKMRGKVLNIRQETIESKKGDKFEKMFVDIEETDTGFNHKHQFEIFGEEAIAVHGKKIKEDRYINIDFYIKSNEWKDKFFNTLNIKDVILEDELEMPNIKQFKENGTPF
tara:strand:+ start:5637 stop:5969 length:333 start_codon:yes stop_codon:yes gene_type:complete